MADLAGTISVIGRLGDSNIDPSSSIRKFFQQDLSTLSAVESSSDTVDAWAALDDRIPRRHRACPLLSQNGSAEVAKQNT
jgi:hypothetical protein